jgi:hypothetical protein
LSRYCLPAQDGYGRRLLASKHRFSYLSEGDPPACRAFGSNGAMHGGQSLPSNEPKQETIGGMLGQRWQRPYPLRRHDSCNTLGSGHVDRDTSAAVKRSNHVHCLDLRSSASARRREAGTSSLTIACAQNFFSIQPQKYRSLSARMDTWPSQCPRQSAKKETTTR